jgi:hypothetical protein
VSVTSAVGHQPTRVFVNLSHFPGVEIAIFHPVQTDPPLAHALFALDNNPQATQAFTQVAFAVAEKTDSLASELELARIDSSKARLFAAMLRDRPVLVGAEHLALAYESERLAERLEANLAGRAAVEEGASAPATTEDAAQQALAPADFYDLTLATLDDAKSLITFRRNRAAHPEWEQLARTIPQPLVAAIDEWHEAKGDASLSEHEYEEALSGTFYNEWIEPSHRDREETVRMLAARVDCARARLADAVKLVQETQNERDLAENRLAATWLRSHASAFATRFNEYRTALAVHVQVLEASRTGAYVLRGWKDTCACTVLRQIGEVLLQVEDEGERERDWWGTYCLAERFNDLDHDAWRDLRIDVRQEAAKVREPRLLAGSPADTQVPATEQMRAMLFQFHRAVRVVAEKIAAVWRLMQEKGEAGIGLMHVDKCLLRLQEGGTACAELDPQWRDCIRELKAAYDEASSLWQHEHRDGEKGLRALFSQIAQPGVGISNLDATTHHGLVVRLAGVLLGVLVLHAGSARVAIPRGGNLGGGGTRARRVDEGCREPTTRLRWSSSEVSTRTF